MPGDEAQALGGFMNAEKIKKLQALLAVLPDQIARKLAVAVEYDRLDGGALPHDVILEALRPALQRTGLKRQGVPTLQRAFFEPIEDLLTASGEGRKEQACLARRSLTPIWRWLETDLLAAPVARAAKSYTEAVRKADQAGRDQVLGSLWAEAGHAMLEALDRAAPRSPDYDKIVNRLGASHAEGASVLEDAREMALLLQAAPQLRALQAGVPRGTKKLSAEELAFIRQSYDTLMAQLPDQAIYVPVIVMRRLAKPANVMEALKALARTESDAKVAETTLALAGDLLISDFEAKAKFLAGAQLGEANTNEVLAQLEQYTEMSAGLTQSLDIRREGRWGKRLVEARSKLSETMERRIEKIPDEIIGAFPITSAGSYAARGGPRPNFGRWPDDAKIGRASNLAMFLGGSRWLAGKALFGVSHKAAVERISKFLVGYGDDLVGELKAGDPDALARCQAHLQALLRVTELVMGEQEADILRRRAAMAQQPGGTAAA
jgi:hypothetical protein